MSIIIQAKRAGKDNRFFKGETEDLNWEPSHFIMWNRICNKFGGVYTPYPTRAYQTDSFLEFLDRYKDSEYTIANDESEPTPQEVKNPGGHDLRAFLPDRRVVNTEDLSKEDARKKDAALNQNAIKLPPTLQKPKHPPANKIPDPKKVSENERSTQESTGNSNNQDATAETGDTGSNISQTAVSGSKAAPIEQTVVEEAANKESNVRNTENIKRGNNEGSKQEVAGGNPQNPFKKAGINTGASKPASGSTVKVR